MGPFAMACSRQRCHEHFQARPQMASTRADPCVAVLLAGQRVPASFPRAQNSTAPRSLLLCILHRAVHCAPRLAVYLSTSIDIYRASGAASRRYVFLRARSGSCTRQPQHESRAGVFWPAKLRPGSIKTDAHTTSTFPPILTLVQLALSPTLLCTLKPDFLPVPSPTTAAALQGFVSLSARHNTVAAAPHTACLVCQYSRASRSTAHSARPHVSRRVWCPCIVSSHCLPPPLHAQLDCANARKQCFKTRPSHAIPPYTVLEHTRIDSSLDQHTYYCSPWLLPYVHATCCPAVRSCIAWAGIRVSSITVSNTSF